MRFFMNIDKHEVADTMFGVKSVQYKIKATKPQLVVRVKFPQEQLNTRAFNYITTNPFKFFMTPRQLSKTTLEYSCLQSKALNGSLKTLHSRYDFFCIMLQTVLIFKIALVDTGLSANHFVLDLRYVFIHENTKDLHFLYVPLQEEPTKKNCLHTFLHEIAREIYVEDREGFLPGFLHFLNHDTSESVQNIDRIIHYILEKEPGLDLLMDDPQIKKSGFLTDKPVKKLEHEQEKQQAIQTQFDDINTELFKQQPTNAGISLGNPSHCIPSPDTMGDTSLLHMPFEGKQLEDTSLLSHPEGTTASMRRVTTSEVILISKPVFFLGKDNTQVDYVVQGNTAISRTHAKIIEKSGRWFLQDLNSKNHTYVNSVCLAPLQEVPLQDGQSVWLANEEFVFTCVSHGQPGGFF